LLNRVTTQQEHGYDFGPTWTFTNPNKNVHRVEFKRKGNNAKLITGWVDIRRFYTSMMMFSSPTFSHLKKD